MAANDFLPFGTAGGANVTSQATYAGEASTAAGFADGTSPLAADANKIWRQSSSMASMIGKFILDQIAQNVLDNGNIATLEAQFILALQALGRIKMTGNQSFYVSPSGNDSTGTGLVGAPWLTIGHALLILREGYDFGGFTATVQLAHGTYAENVAVNSSLPNGRLQILGDTGSPGSCIIAPAAGNAVVVNGPYSLSLSGVRLSAGGSGAVGLSVVENGVAILDTASFGACSAAQIATQNGGQVLFTGPLEIAGSAPIFASIFGPATLNIQGQALTFTGAPNFSSAFIKISGPGQVEAASVAITGTATGSGWSVVNNGVLTTSGSLANFTGAGLSAGTTASGGIAS